MYYALITMATYMHYNRTRTSQTAVVHHGTYNAEMQARADELAVSSNETALRIWERIHDEFYGNYPTV